MDKFYNKHYIRVDTEGRIIKGFSDAFEQPAEGDICINEHGDRHFEMLEVVNLLLMNTQGIYLYKYVGGIVARRTAEEIQAEIKNLPPPAPTPMEAMQEVLDALLFESLGGGTNV